VKSVGQEYENFVVVV